MAEKIDEKDYPLLVEFMDKFLYQLAAPSFEEAIAVYHVEGTKPVNQLLTEIAHLLSAEHSEQDLVRFVDQHADYMRDSARGTLEYIAEVLKGKP